MIGCRNICVLSWRVIFGFCIVYVENFVCDVCKEKYNNKSPVVDRRIMYSRTKMFKYIENKLYEELEDKLKGGK